MSGQKLNHTQLDKASAILAAAIDVSGAAALANNSGATWGAHYLVQQAKDLVDALLEDLLTQEA